MIIPPDQKDSIQCPNCKEECDPHVCWCGDWIDKHTYSNSNHSPIPWGCRCGFNDSAENKNKTQAAADQYITRFLSLLENWDKLTHQQRIDTLDSLKVEAKEIFKSFYETPFDI